MGEVKYGDNVLVQMFRTTQAVRALVARAVSDTGILPDEYAVLSMVGLMGSASPTALASRLRVPPPTISRYVADFVDAGLATRLPNPNDGRSYLLELTSDGRDLVGKVAPRIRQTIDELAQRIPIDEVETALVELEQAARAIAAFEVPAG